MNVFKYPIDPADVVEVELPEGAKPLHFDMQNGRFYLWALVDPERPTTTYRFRMAGTGHPIDTVGDFVNTVLINGGQMVFHFFYA
jgi:hypothetical protein